MAGSNRFPISKTLSLGGERLAARKDGEVQSSDDDTGEAIGSTLEDCLVPQSDVTLG